MDTEFTRERDDLREDGKTRPGVTWKNQNDVAAEAPRPQQRKQLLEITSGASVIGGMAGAGGATLAILGLAGVLPFYMTTIGTIALGAGLFVDGGALGAATSKLEQETNFDERLPTTGFAMQSLAGAGAMILGILSLIGVLPAVLIPVAILVMGGALAFGGPARAELNLSALELGGGSARARRIAADAVHSSGGVLMLMGLGAITLGILALVPVARAQTLELVALLAIGGSLLLTDSVLLGRVGMAWHR